MGSPMSGASATELAPVGVHSSLSGSDESRRPPPPVAAVDLEEEAAALAAEAAAEAYAIVSTSAPYASAVRTAAEAYVAATGGAEDGAPAVSLVVATLNPEAASLNALLRIHTTSAIRRCTPIFDTNHLIGGAHGSSPQELSPLACALRAHHVLLDAALADDESSLEAPQRLPLSTPKPRPPSPSRGERSGGGSDGTAELRAACDAVLPIAPRLSCWRRPLLMRLPAPPPPSAAEAAVASAAAAAAAARAAVLNEFPRRAAAALQRGLAGATRCAVPEQSVPRRATPPEGEAAAAAAAVAAAGAAAATAPELVLSAHENSLTLHRLGHDGDAFECTTALVCALEAAPELTADAAAARVEPLLGALYYDFHIERALPPALLVAVPAADDSPAAAEGRPPSPSRRGHRRRRRRRGAPAGGRRRAAAASSTARHHCSHFAAPSRGRRRARRATSSSARRRCTRRWKARSLRTSTSSPRRRRRPPTARRRRPTRRRASRSSAAAALEPSALRCPRRCRPRSASRGSTTARRWR